MASSVETISSTSIDLEFERLRSERKKALVCYVTAGYPDQGTSLELVRGLGHAGADVIEIGLPFSDPIADGPVIQASSQHALATGMNLDRTLDLVSRAQTDIPIVLFTYLNPLLAAGSDVLSRCRDSGVNGVLVTDLPVGADPSLESWIGESDLDYIRLVAPTTPETRMREIAEKGSGFVYLISRLGVTGVTKGVPHDLAETTARLRRATSLPVCIGFGISEPAQARAVAALADGVVIGSALVKKSASGPEAAWGLVSALRSGLDEASDV